MNDDTDRERLKREIRQIQKDLKTADSSTEKARMLKELSEKLEELTVKA